MKHDHILVIGFGSPRSAEEITPFIRSVAEGKNISERCLESVVSQYKAIGGFSSYHDHVLRFVDSLKKNLASTGVYLPVFIGMRNGNPFLRDTLHEICQKGFRSGLAVMLTAFRFDSSDERVFGMISEAKKSRGCADLQYDFLDEWCFDPDFIEAHANALEDVLRKTPLESRADIPVIFSAHSIPVKKDVNHSSRPYSEKVCLSSDLVAKHAGLKKWQIAYQSCTKNPETPWLGPGVCETVRGLFQEGEKSVVIAPIGFLCDHKEVLYDLDVEAKKNAHEMQMTYWRAGTIMNQPKFIFMFLRQIKEAVLGQRVA